MISKKEVDQICTEMEFLPTFPEFLMKRPIYYKVMEGKERYEVLAMEEK
jgi:hypothetical protein